MNSRKSESEVELAMEARSNDSYQPLENFGPQTFQKMIKKYVIIGSIVITVLIIGTISSVLLYSENESLHQELDRFQEIDQVEEKQIIPKHNGVFVVDDPRKIPQNDQSISGDKTESPPAGKKDAGKSQSTTIKPDDTHKIDNGTIIPEDNVPTENKNKTETDDTPNNSSEKPNKKTAGQHVDHSVVFLNQLPGIHAVYSYEECMKDKLGHGFKCSLEITAPFLTKENKFVGYGSSKRKARKAAADSSLGLFNTTSTISEGDKAASEHVKLLCERPATKLVVATPAHN